MRDCASARRARDVPPVAVHRRAVLEEPAEKPRRLRGDCDVVVHDVRERERRERGDGEAPVDAKVVLGSDDFCS